MDLNKQLHKAVQSAITEIFNATVEQVDFQPTRKEFAGDVTLVVFSLLRTIKGNPVEIGTKIGEYLVANQPLVTNFNVVKGFLNLEIDPTYYLDLFYQIFETENYGLTSAKANDTSVMVEYCSPNTNKPLHLGHIRNNLLGFSVAEIIEASGKKVYKTQIINDRGIHICKSMLAWERYGNNETPESTGLKGDKLVGNYYVMFEKVFQEEYSNWLKTEDGENEFKKFLQKPLIEKDEELISVGNIEKTESLEEKKELFKKIEIQNRKKFKSKFKNEYFSKISLIGGEAKEMLQNWENGEEKTVVLWKKMNQWVYDGFEQTFTALGVDFDKNYYESETYLLGKEFIAEGLKTDAFFKKEDGSVWCDLTDEGLDEKIVLRSDGTAVYMTQDIGTAIQRIKDYPDVGGMVYTVGNEQDYHFKVLFLILKKLGFEWSKNLFHLSYGMVELPEGKMKSREGTVVDADDLMIEMIANAKEISEELGKLEGYTTDEKEDLYRVIGMAALKYYILKVDPKKTILFDPKESIDFNGNTGPFIQYTYARIQSLKRRADFDYSAKTEITSINEKEVALIKQINAFAEVIQTAAKNYSPALIANYTYDLVKEYNSFYQSNPIFANNNQVEKVFRIQLSHKTGEVIKTAFSLLGIEVPNRM